MNYVLLQEKLLEDLDEIKRRNPSYSLRSYAKRLGISPSSLSGILNGRRKVSKSMALKIVQGLKIKDKEKDYFLCEVLTERNKAKSVELKMDEYKMIAEWHHFAILSLIKLDDFQYSYSWIAERLNISSLKAEAAIKRLLRLKLLKEEKNTLKRTHFSITTSDGLPNLSLRESHRENLRLASESLDMIPIELRDIVSLTFPLNTEKIFLAKEKIRQFVTEIDSLFEMERKEEVYKLCVQLFPLTKTKERM